VNNKNESSGVVKNTGTVREIIGFDLFGRDKSSLLRLIESDIEKKRKIWIATVNTEFVMLSKRDKSFLKLLESKTTYNVIDGIGLIWALKVIEVNGFISRFVKAFWVGVEILRGGMRSNLITGADLLDDLCRMAAEKGLTVYFYGGWDDRSAKSASFFLKKYPKLKVVGARAEDFDFKTKVDFLFVCRAMGKQEKWIDDNFDKLNCKLVIGLGRTFDYYSGKLPRAPRWMQKMGLEWLFTLIVDTKRWRRQLALPKFIWMVLNS
jgi:N-acetylglucosaminyldiphosphoundecaprenol N-acetyl-beta-D-mannosaminyltransferase